MDSTVPIHTDSRITDHEPVTFSSDTVLCIETALFRFIEIWGRVRTSQCAHSHRTLIYYVGFDSQVIGAYIGIIIINVSFNRGLWSRRLVNDIIRCRWNRCRLICYTSFCMRRRRKWFGTMFCLRTRMRRVELRGGGGGVGGR